MKNLLPIGSVVLLKDATKKLVIIGILQVNPSDVSAGSAQPIWVGKKHPI